MAPGNPGRGLPRIQGLYLLLDPATLAPLALLDAVELTVLRTAAVSALAVRHLAAAGAARVVLFGTGPQGWGHLEALRAVRPVAEVVVVGRDPQRTERFLRRCGEHGMRARAGGPGDVAGADLVVAATTSRAPLFDGALVRETACVVAVGSHEPDARELDAALLERSVVVVEDVGSALREAGDVVLAVGEGRLDPRGLLDLRSLVGGRRPGSGRPQVFKSVGMAWEDLVLARLAVCSIEGAGAGGPR